MNLFENVYSLCEKNGMSVHKLEKELGFGNRSIYKWKSISPSIDKIKAVAEYFGVSIDYLVYGSEQTSAALDPTEQELIDIYQDLNKEGQEDLLKYAALLSGSPQYQKKDHQSEVV